MGADMASMLDGIHSESTAFVADCRELNRDQFLNLSVMKNGETVLQVKDILRYGILIAGGVHHAAAKSDKELSLQALDASFIAGGGPINAYQMRGIGLVILDGLEPLRQRVAEDLTKSTTKTESST